MQPIRLLAAATLTLATFTTAGCGSDKDETETAEPSYSQKAMRARLSKEYLPSKEDASGKRGDQPPRDDTPDRQAASTTQHVAKQPEDGDAAASPSGKTGAVESRYQALMVGLTVFVLAIFVGFEVITKVPPTLHTPLMSGSNAISGITLVGAVTVTGVGTTFSFSVFTGFVAIVLATINVVGGFLVTHRMLSMFRKR